MNKNDLKTLIDRPNLIGFNAFNTMFKELALFMTDHEVDQVIDFMYEIEQSEFDINPSISDSKTQFEIMLGKDRYQEVVNEWKKHNQKTLSEYGTLKYQCKKTSTLYDGLDPEDNPDDYIKVYV